MRRRDLLAPDTCASWSWDRQPEVWRPVAAEKREVLARQIARECRRGLRPGHGLKPDERAEIRRRVASGIIAQTWHGGGSVWRKGT